MNTQRQAILKHFSLVLKKRSQSNDPDYPSIDDGILKYLSRKDLIQIISLKHDGDIPKDIPIAEMENQDLLKVVGNDLHIISYMLGQWSKEIRPVIKEPEKKEVEVKSDLAIGTEQPQNTIKKK